MVDKFKQTRHNTTYQIHLRVKRKVEKGQSITLHGGIPELGWNKEKPGYRMKWQEGDYWVTDEPITTKQYYFQYKYVLWDDSSNSIVSYERGIDRLIDCEVLDDHSTNSQFGFVFNTKAGEDSHCVILDEVFEAFTTCFSVNFPEPDISDSMVLIGSHKAIPTILMMKDTDPTSWMPVKYGEAKQPFKITCLMENTSSGENGQWKIATTENQVMYEYQLSNKTKNSKLIERAPKRNFTILDPSKYKGELGASGSTLWANTEEVFVVNGFVNKADGNFELEFKFQKIEEFGVTIGSYPQKDNDISQLRSNGCNSVLDI